MRAASHAAVALGMPCEKASVAANSTRQALQFVQLERNFSCAETQ
jgi:hypothetical protein